MKTGRTIQELAIELDRQQKSKRDFMVPANKIEAYAHVGVLELGFAFNKDGDHFSGSLTENGHNQLGQYCNIPAKYYDLMKASSGELLAANVKHWLSRSTDRRFVRSLDGNVRALLSDKYRRLDNFDLAQHILPIIGEAEAVVESSEITENKLYIKAITHKVQAEITVGDVVSAGIMVSNSETGHGSLSVKPFIYRLVYRNGAVAEDYSMRKYHAGRANEMEQIEFSNETLKADDHAFWLKVRDLVKHSMSQVTFEKIVDSMRESTKRVISQPEYAIELASDKYKLNQSEQSDVLKHLIEGGSLTSWGLGNAITRAAHDVDSYDRSTELESIGYQVMLGNWN